MKNYEAILIDPELPNGREAGNLTILETDRIRFTSENGSRDIPFGMLEITSGGAGNRLIFFKSQKAPNVSIYTSDRTILKDVSLSRHESLKLQVKDSRRGLKKIRYAAISIFAFFVLVIIGLYLSKDYFVRKMAEQVPASWEKKAGDHLFTAISGQYEIIHHDSLEKVFLQVAEPLLKQVRKQGVKIDLYFINDPAINAFALPGGKVVIQTGLLDNAKSWEEVLGVLSHELAHVTERHHIRGIISNMGLYAIISASVGDMSAIAGTIASMGGDLASLANSRKFETEADEAGWDYLVKGHIDPSGMITFFETLASKDKGKEGYLSFLSTHPETKERIAHLKKKLSKKEVHFTRITHDFTAFKEALNKYK